MNLIKGSVEAGPLPDFLSLLSLRRSVCGSKPAERQTSGKSFSSLKRYDSASRCEPSGPEIHSSTARAITAVQMRCSAITSMFDSDIANIWPPVLTFYPLHNFFNAQGWPMGVWRGKSGEGVTTYGSNELSE